MCGAVGACCDDGDDGGVMVAAAVACSDLARRDRLRRRW